MSKLKFNKISIVESLRPNEKKTGQLLVQDLEMLEVFHEKGISIEYVLISSKQELIDHIQSLVTDANNSGIFPVLQIDAHGSNDKKSLVLSSGEVVSWLDLGSIFRPLNIATKCNVLIVMATCFGAYINSTISLFDRAPFWGVIGAELEIYPDQMLSNLTGFYTKLYNSVNPEELLTSLKSSPSELKFITSEWFFVNAYKSYILEECNENMLNVRAKGVMTKFSEQGKKPLNIEEIKKRLKPEGKKGFEKLLHYFFMIDLYPQNIEKISVKFEQLNL